MKMENAKVTVMTFDAQDVITTSGEIKGYYGKGNTLEEYNMSPFAIGIQDYTMTFDGYKDDSNNYLATFVSIGEGNPASTGWTFELFEGDTTDYVEITNEATIVNAFNWLKEHGQYNQ